MMRSKASPRLRSSVAIAAVMLLACAARAGVENLVSNSPFLPQSAVAQAAGSGGSLDRYELRGVASFNGVLTFSVYDTTNNRGYWIPLNSSQDGIRVSSYDDSREAVVIEGEGATKRLVLKEAQIQTMTVAAPPPAAPPGVVQGSPLPAAPGAINTEQEMAERRQRIIEELRRRRAARQQTQQAAPQ